MPFKEAKAQQAALKLGIYGPTGSGKTFSSLLFAEGLAKHYGGKVAVVDTEHGSDFYAMDVGERRIHPSRFVFDALYSRSITEIVRECRAIDPKEYSVVVIDSMTHLWEACIASYTGPKMKNGGIPMWAWGKIKKPYKDLMTWMISTPCHVIIAGRQGNEFEEDDTGEIKVVGYKMKAEGETQYEPHILLRMDHEQDGKVSAIVEKDRIGILEGRRFTNPSYEEVIEPLLHLLGGSQAVIDPDEDAMKDSEEIARQEFKKEVSSKQNAKRFIEKIEQCVDKDSLRSLWKEVSKDKKSFLPQDLSEVRKEIERKKAVFEALEQTSGN